MKPLYSKLFMVGLILILVGLLAVVTGTFVSTMGMIGSFDEVAEAGPDAAPEDLADGVAGTITAATIGVVGGITLGGAGLVLQIAAALAHLLDRRGGASRREREEAPRGP